MMRDGGRNMNRLFRNILKENKNDYIRTVLGCSWIISLIYFSTAVGGCLSYISTGTIPQMTYLILEVEKEFLIPYGLLLFLSIWFIVIPADLTVERIHKKTSSYIQNINCIWNEKKA